MGKASRRQRTFRNNDRAPSGANEPEAGHDAPLKNSDCEASGPYQKYLLAGAVGLATFLLYLSSLRNDFVNWDDDFTIYQNPEIRRAGWRFLRWAFTDFSSGIWHPLTWISYALDYRIWGLNPLGYHFTAVILHALNTALVVLLVLQLIGISGRGAGEGIQTKGPHSPDSSYSPAVAAAAAGLLFGLHPLHVESVAWAAERKDLLCGLFYLLSVMAYIEGAVSGRGEGRQCYRYHILSLLLFLLALSSKAMAVSLPVVLLILDWHPLNRIKTAKDFIASAAAKLPFFGLSLLMSFVAVAAQKSVGAMAPITAIPLSGRVMTAFKALAAYLWKMVLPVNLMPFYPYQKRFSLLSAEVAVPAVIAVAITLLCIALAKKQKIWAAAWFFYVVTLLPVIGIVQVGSQAMADRYTYLPSLGPFILTGLAAAWGWRRLKSRGVLLRISGMAAASLLTVSLIFLTYNQIGIWKNSLTLWSYSIEKQPETVPLAYKLRGNYFDDMNLTDRAMADYSKAVELDPTDFRTLNNRGLLFDRLGSLDKAVEDFDRALALRNDFYAYVNRGRALEKLGKPGSAVADFDRALSLNPSDPRIYYFRGRAYSAGGNREKALSDFRKACELGVREACSASQMSR